MQLQAEQSVSEDNECIFNVSVPPTRSDVLHACDVAEVWNYTNRVAVLTHLPLNGSILVIFHL